MTDDQIIALKRALEDFVSRFEISIARMEKDIDNLRSQTRSFSGQLNYFEQEDSWPTIRQKIKIERMVEARVPRISILAGPKIFPL